MITRKITNNIIYKNEFMKDMPMATTDYTITTYVLGIRVYRHNFKEDISSINGKSIPKQSIGFDSPNKKT